MLLRWLERVLMSTIWRWSEDVQTVLDSRDRRSCSTTSPLILSDRFGCCWLLRTRTALSLMKKELSVQPIAECKTLGKVQSAKLEVDQ